MFADKLREWQQAADHFLSVVEGIPPAYRSQAGACGHWNVQQVVAHLAGWQREALKHYQHLLAGDLSGRRYDLDAFNAGSVNALKLLGWHDVLDTFRFTRDDLLAAAQGLTEAQLAETPFYGRWLDALSKDLSTHSQEIEAWLLAQQT